jgi:hypothetical protein
MSKFKFSRYGGYECSSKGDRRFSAFFARMSDGRTIEEHYQCDIKGYQPGGTDWSLGKGKPGLHPDRDLWEGYLNLWKLWASDHPQEMSELKFRAESRGNTLSDCFAKTSVNQARALAFILNEMELYESESPSSLQHL